MKTLVVQLVLSFKITIVANEPYSRFSGMFKVAVTDDSLIYLTYSTGIWTLKLLYPKQIPVALQITGGFCHLQLLAFIAPYLRIPSALS